MYLFWMVGRGVGLVTDFDIACYATSELGRILTMLKPASSRGTLRDPTES